MLAKLKSYITSGDGRSVKAKKNILAMLFIRGGSIAINLLLVPLTLDYVDSDTYGVWLTLSSMIAWLSFFDIGLNNGLKNKLAEAWAQNNLELAKKYVSTTYAILILIFMPVMVIGLIVAPMLNWHSLLNLSPEGTTGLLTAVCIIIAYFCIQFVLSTINVILTADQRPADASLRSLIQNIITLIIIAVLVKTTEGSLVNLCLALCAAPLIVLLIFNFTLFKDRYKDIRPSYKSVDFAVAPSLFKLGVQFFIIQIAAIIQFQLANFLIMRYYGATEVTAYNIAYKYFNVIYMIWGIIITPLWAAVTDAAARNEYGWIKNAIKKYLRIFILMSVGLMVMLLASGFVYDIWIGDKVEISFMLSLWVALYFLMLMFGTTFVSTLNGLGKLKVQTIASTISPLVFLCCVFALIKTGVGVYSILIASIVANFNGIILAPIQCLKYFKNK